MATLVLDNFSETALGQPLRGDPFGSFEGSSGWLSQSGVFVDSGLSSTNVVSGRRELFPTFCDPSIASGKISLTKNQSSQLLVRYQLDTAKDINSVSFQFGTVAASVKMVCAFRAAASAGSLPSAGIAYFTAVTGSTVTINAGSFSGGSLTQARSFCWRILPDANTSGLIEILDISADVA